MKSTISLPERLSHLLESTKEYVETKVELEVLKGADKIAQGLSILASILAAMAMGSLIILLVCIGFAIWINESMQSGYLGYFIVAGAVLIILVLVFRPLSRRFWQRSHATSWQSFPHFRP